MAAGVDDPIHEDERFFRRILPKDVKSKPDGRKRLSSSAFSDRDLEPSVDREKLTEPLGGAEFTRQEKQNGVVFVTAADVRGIDITHQPKGEPVGDYVADLERRRLPENPAHYVVLLQPATNKRGVFKKLIERLARKGEKQWVIKPGEDEGRESETPDHHDQAPAEAHEQRDEREEAGDGTARSRRWLASGLALIRGALGALRRVCG